MRRQGAGGLTSTAPSAREGPLLSHLWETGHSDPCLSEKSGVDRGPACEPSVFRSPSGRKTLPGDKTPFTPLCSLPGLFSKPSFTRDSKCVMSVKCVMNGTGIAFYCQDPNTCLKPRPKSLLRIRSCELYIKEP